MAEKSPSTPSITNENSFSGPEWFKVLFGFPESINDGPDANLELIEKNLTASQDADTQLVTLKSSVNGKEYGVGKFSMKSLGDYERSPPAHIGGGKLNIIVGNGKIGPLTDVLRSHNASLHSGSSFQLASNYNGLEYTSRYGSACRGVCGYYMDTTQGPYGALAAAPAAVWRNYFLPHHGLIGQTKKEINFLERTPIRVEHGYALIDHDQSKTLEDSGFDWNNPDNYQVGVHEHVQVVLNRGTGRFFPFSLSPENQYANQIYCAAFNMAQDVYPTRFSENLAQTILKHQYKATIYAAWEMSIRYPDLPGSKKLFLTHVGGGVFHNDPDWIANAISECEELISDSGLEVFDVHFNSTVFQRYFAVLEETVKRTGGEVIKI
eukprot:TRINITY_DN8853_c0_g1_i1.p1 TRINITY_DN8853_c0_g1~~TRINITY_DN8853_c0_g1_i1.p1  ORF type:complete len:379 (+),score=63.96 TRINITY_DN8853_c0_g1_i1:19-1155(+)